MEDTKPQAETTTAPTSSTPVESFQSSPDSPLPVPETVADDTSTQQTITWTASEFVQHQKSAGWYLILGVTATVVAILMFLITKDFVSVGVVVLGAIVLGVYAGHQPRQLQYQVDSTGLTIGEKRLIYNEFRSFSIVPEDAFSSIVFMPLKRFAMPAVIYYAPEDEEKIVSVLSGHLPFEERNRDAIDRLMYRIRF